MSDPTNRYQIPAKRAAYEEAILIASKADTLALLTYTYIMRALGPHKISQADRGQVAAKALRVERGRRRQREAEVITEEDTT